MKVCADQCRYHLAQAATLLDRLDDSHRAFEPQPGAKTAGWLAGHLAVTGDFGRFLCGDAALCSREWRTAFNPGSLPSTDPAAYPPMRQLCDTFRAVYESLCVSAVHAAPERLAGSNPYLPARAAFPTAGDFVAYLLTGHLGCHLGQLTGWCAAAGLGGLRVPTA